MRFIGITGGIVENILKMLQRCANVSDMNHAKPRIIRFARKIVWYIENNPHLGITCPPEVVEFVQKNEPECEDR